MRGSGDYISREAAIESMYKDAEAHQDHTFWTTQYEALLNIPAADVRPVVRGKWEPNVPPRDLRPRCSVCGELQPRKTNYCPNCGADMMPEPPKEE